jgi:hypothetical protein
MINSNKRPVVASQENLVQRLGRIDKALGESVDLRNAVELTNFRTNYSTARQLRQRLQIGECLREFTDNASRLEWSSKEHFRDTLLAYWWQLQEELVGNYDRPLSENLCETCFADSMLVTINEELRLFGCTRHGVVHACVGRCAALATTKEWTAVCIFSGKEVDRFFSSARDAKFDAKDHQAGFKYAMAIHELDMFPDYEFRGGAGSDDTPSSPTPLLKKIDARTPLKAFQHKRKRKRDDEQRAEDAQRRTWRFGKVINEITKTAERRLRSVADKVIQDVLFDKETRILYNTMAIDEAHNIARQRLITYYSQCKARSELPNRIQSECIFATPFRCIALLTLVDDDRVRKSRFASLCSRLWAICHRSPYARSITERLAQAATSSVRTTQSRHSVRQTTCLYEQFCLGVLYTMRYGITVKTCDPFLYIQREFRFVPCDPRLSVDLPAEDRIDMFGDNGRRELAHNAEPTSSTVQFGEKSKQKRARSDIFKTNGTLKVRKARTKRRVTTVGSGSRRIPQLRNAAISERDVMPPHLHSSLLVVSNTYEKHDITRGRNFLRECLNSLTEEELESTARSLRY